MSLLPVLVVGGAFVVLSSKKKKRKRSGLSKKALPAPASERGEIFEGWDPPDMIIDRVGSRFSIAFDEIDSTGHSWRLSATPPDDSIKLISKEHERRPVFEPGVPGGVDIWVFEGGNVGEGSIVFHLDPPGAKDQPPADIVEIKTRIS